MIGLSYSSLYNKTLKTISQKKCLYTFYERRELFKWSVVILWSWPHKYDHNYNRRRCWVHCEWRYQMAPHFLDGIPFLGRLPNFGSRPNTMGGKFPSVCPYVRVSVRPRKVSISMKFGVQVVLDERWKKVMTMPGSKVKVKVRSPRKSEIRPFWTIFKLYLLPHLYWGLTNDHGFLN